ncbi:MAG: c(7)-type cytochrome triheme domain-containing protein [Alphaproteobacteria bacterium]
MFNRRDITVVVAVGTAIVLLTSCSADTRKSWLATFFDDVDKPPPTRRVRTDLQREVEELKRQLAQARQEVKAAQEEAKKKGTERKAPPIEKAEKWDEAEKLLPKDKSGRVDWVQAIKTGVIAPRPSPNPGGPEQAVLDLDVELTSSRDKLFHVTYPHNAHTNWLACANCHPAIFPLRKAKPTIITMAKIRAGEYCGACHGKVAFGITNECPRCHTSAQPSVEWHPPEPRKPIEKAQSWNEAAKLLPVTQGVPDWAKALRDGVISPRAGVDPKAADQPVLPLDVELVPAAGEMFKVTFPHKSHTEWLQCPNCHTGIFQMAKGADPITMEKINAGQYCGVCHGKVAFAPTACGRCHPALAGGK